MQDIGQDREKRESICPFIAHLCTSVTEMAIASKILKLVPK